MARHAGCVLLALLLSLALSLAVLCVGVQTTLLDEDNATAAAAQSGYAAGLARDLQQEMAAWFETAGLPPALLDGVVDEQTVGQALAASARDLMRGGDGVVDAAAQFEALRPEAVAELEADGASLTENGAAQLDALLALCGQQFSGATLAPVAPQIAVLRQGVWGFSWPLVLAASAILALLCGLALGFLARDGAARWLYFGSALLGSGLTLFATSLALQRASAGTTGVLTAYFGDFTRLLAWVGGPLAALMLVVLVVRLVLARKKA